MIARLIDGFILWLVGFVALAAVSVVSGMEDETSVIRALFLWMALGLVYDVCFTATRGQTPGKQAVGIQVVGPDGQPPGWIRSVKRTALGIVAGALPGPAGDVAGSLVEARVFWDKERQGYHDLFAGTHVVRQAQQPPVRVRRR